MQGIEKAYDQASRKVEEFEYIIINLKESVNQQNQDIEGKNMLLEDERNFILMQDNELTMYKTDIKDLEFEYKKIKKDLADFKNLAPFELRNAPNPFKILTKQIADLREKIDVFENSRNDVKDVEIQ